MNSNVQTTSGRSQNGSQGPSRRTDDDVQQPFVVPPVDVFEDPNGITLLADLPGVARDQLGVRVDGDMLVIEATATSAAPKDLELVYGEAQVPAYRRQFTLSRELDASRIDAQLKDGVLRLTIPKAEEAKPRRIEIRVG